ncbi:MAG: DUF6705 family protein [Bacteroidia bacterium]
MKKIFLIAAISSIFSCKAQRGSFYETVGLEDSSVEYALTGKYYKDLNNTLNNFTGTYLYTNGATSFKIILQKKIESSINDRYKEDILIGSYQYVENGVEKINVLNDINNNYPNGWKYNIHGNDILVGPMLGCTDCGVNEKWISGTIIDRLPNGGGPATLFIRKVMVGGQEAIKIWIYMEMYAVAPGTPPINSIAYPIGEEFILIKQ